VSYDKRKKVIHVDKVIIKTDKVIIKRDDKNAIKSKIKNTIPITSIEKMITEDVIVDSSFILN
jgi:hypothetical protein